MTQPNVATRTVVGPTLVVLSSSVWRAELEAELIRVGVSAERAPISATRILHRVCGHAGYHQCFLNIGEEPRTSDKEPTQ